MSLYVAYVGSVKRTGVVPAEPEEVVDEGLLHIVGLPTRPDQLQQVPQRQLRTTAQTHTQTEQRERVRRDDTSCMTQEARRKICSSGAGPYPSFMSCLARVRWMWSTMWFQRLRSYMPSALA